MRIDLEQVAAAALDTGNIEMMLGHVVVLGEEMYCWLGDLHIQVVVPWEDLQVLSVDGFHGQGQEAAPSDSTTRLEASRA